MPETLEEKAINEAIDDAPFRFEITSNDDAKEALIGLLKDYIAVYAGTEAADDCETALGEVLNNALYHGNLELKDLTNRGEMKKRLDDPKYNQRKIIVNYARSGDSLTFMVMDQGKGFNFEEPLEGAQGKDILKGLSLKMIHKFASEFYCTNGNNSGFMIKYLR